MIVLSAKYVLPVCEPPIADGSVAIDGGIIRYVGPSDGAPPGERRDLGNVLLMPGLVNAHTHLELTAMRGFLEDLDFRRWIVRLTSAKRSVLSREMLLDSARLGIAEGLRAGITTYADTCDSGVAFDAMVESGVRGIMYQEVFGPDPAICDAAMADLRQKVAEFRSRETALVRVGISPHAPYTVSDALFRATAEYAERERLPIAIHIAESELESRLVVDGTGPFAEGLRARGIAVEPRAGSPIVLLATLGVLDRRPLLIHCVRVDADDIAAIAGAAATVVHCPISNAKLGHGIAPLIELLDAGVEVGLGSDSVAGNNRMDLLEEARAAVLFQRARLTSHEALTAHDALELATIRSARAIGLGTQIGSLEAGKSADLVAFPIGHRTPVQDPEATAVFSMGGATASFVMIAGNTLIDSAKPLAPDTALQQRVQHSADQLREWLDSGGELIPPPPIHLR